MEKRNQILNYCKDNLQYMWASKIVSILLDCDFRDAKSALNEYFNEYEEEE